MTLLDTPALRRLAEAATPTRPTCACRLQDARAWESITEERWPKALMEQVGTLRDPDTYEPTFEEFHPAGTHFWSPEAPIAPRYFPANRSDVWECTTCGRVFLRYVEGGGYFVDRRVRPLAGELLVDAAI